MIFLFFILSLKEIFVNAEVFLERNTKAIEEQSFFVKNEKKEVLTPNETSKQAIWQEDSKATFLYQPIMTIGYLKYKNLCLDNNNNLVKCGDSSGSIDDQMFIVSDQPSKNEDEKKKEEPTKESLSEEPKDSDISKEETASQSAKKESEEKKETPPEKVKDVNKLIGEAISIIDTENECEAGNSPKDKSKDEPKGASNTDEEKKLNKKKPEEGGSDLEPEEKPTLPENKKEVLSVVEIDKTIPLNGDQEQEKKQTESPQTTDEENKEGRNGILKSDSEKESKQIKTDEKPAGKGTKKRGRMIQKIIDSFEKLKNK
ncbi:hypothetical protein TUBRATIS_005090 [Tubulinosema ratisbonensis]|uniref:Uncharacterized protein n=1 Tax=Tubulinosema ratisbonensis TaxID=291195 RepID=A0A437APM8_9MICR|nr:hypothetical protein TUBRATIS_005090 [Tubulinosema ratisbonensis]